MTGILNNLVQSFRDVWSERSILHVSVFLFCYKLFLHNNILKLGLATQKFLNHPRNVIFNSLFLLNRVYEHGIV